MRATQTNMEESECHAKRGHSIQEEDSDKTRACTLKRVKTAKAFAKYVFVVLDFSMRHIYPSFGGVLCLLIK